MKALQFPKKYGLQISKININQLPVLIYTDKNELERRIKEKHTASLFKEWDRIAKALKALEMHNSGFSEDVISKIDSNPSQLIKLANFYYDAVNVVGEDLKKLLRRGKGKSGGKAIIFERLFSYSKQCGYSFKGKPSYKIEILDKTQFESYINALTVYLKDNPTTSHHTIDVKKDDFLQDLAVYGFKPSISKKITTTIIPKVTPVKTSMLKKGSIKSRPVIKRKQVLPKIKHLINECYDLDNNFFSNAKVALSRVVFECVLKYIVVETIYKGKKLKDYNHFRPAFYDKRNNQRKFTDFDNLRMKFIELILETGKRKAFEQFDLDRLHQIIHNYNVGAGPNDARTVSDNLISLIEFMLQETGDLFSSLDTNKLV